MVPPPPLDDLDDEAPAHRRWRWFTLPRMLTVFAGVVMALVVLATVVSLSGPAERLVPRDKATSAVPGDEAPASR